MTNASWTCSFPAKMDATHAWENNALGYSILLGIYALRIHIYIYIFQLLKLEVLEKKTCLGPWSKRLLAVGQISKIHQENKLCQKSEPNKLDKSTKKNFLDIGM